MNTDSMKTGSEWNNDAITQLGGGKTKNVTSMRKDSTHKNVRQGGRNFFSIVEYLR